MSSSHGGQSRKAKARTHAVLLLFALLLTPHAISTKSEALAEGVAMGLTTLTSEGSGALRLLIPADTAITDVRVEASPTPESIGLLLTGPEHFVFFQSGNFRSPPHAPYRNLNGTYGFPAGEYHLYVAASGSVTLTVTFYGLSGSATHALQPWSGHALRMRNIGHHLGVPEEVHYYNPLSPNPGYIRVPPHPFRAFWWEEFTLESPGAIIVLGKSSSHLVFGQGVIVGSRASVVNEATGEAKCRVVTVVPEVIGGAAWDTTGFPVSAGRWEARQDVVGVGLYAQETYAMAVPLRENDAFASWWAWSYDFSSLSSIRNLMINDAVREATNDAYCTPRPSV